jgi:hypothetical protein
MSLFSSHHSIKQHGSVHIGLICGPPEHLNQHGHVDASVWGGESFLSSPCLNLGFISSCFCAVMIVVSRATCSLLLGFSHQSEFHSAVLPVMPKTYSLSMEEVLAFHGLSSDMSQHLLPIASNEAHSHVDVVKSSVAKALPSDSIEVASSSSHATKSATSATSSLATSSHESR